MTRHTDFIATVEQAMHRRFLRQLERHQRVDPTVSAERVLKIQMAQEHERLTRYAEELEAEGKDMPAEVIHLLIESLPEFEQRLKRRSGLH